MIGYTFANCACAYRYRLHVRLLVVGGLEPACSETKGSRRQTRTGRPRTPVVDKGGKLIRPRRGTSGNGISEWLFFTIEQIRFDTEIKRTLHNRRRKYEV